MSQLDNLGALSRALQNWNGWKAPPRPATILIRRQGLPESPLSHPSNAHHKVSAELSRENKAG